MTDPLPISAKVIEVAIGRDTAALEWLADLRPDLALAATDIASRPRTLPDSVQYFADDLFEPDADLYRGAALIYARRCPEELQGPLLRLAQGIGSAAAISPLKDEWAQDTHMVQRPLIISGPDGRSWRYYPTRAARLK